MRILLKSLKLIFFAIGGFLSVLIILLALPYLFSPIYDFPKAQPFSGKQWYNPYENPDLHWYIANFHAHTRSWGGMTDGRDSPQALVNAYQEMNYDIISASNYQRIIILSDSLRQVFSVYEHGYNVKKTHQLSIGARSVLWLDYVFGQNAHHKQHIIDLLKKRSDLVVLAHPRYHHGYSANDLSKICGYDGFETLNHFKTSQKLWDAALSSGRLGWIFGDDDTHKIRSRKQTGVRWTLINADQPTRESILEAARAGRTIGVRGVQGVLENELVSLCIDDDTLRVVFEKPAKQIRLIGQGGDVRLSVNDVNSATLPLATDDTYIRTELKDDQFWMFLNPVIRYNGESLPRLVAVMNTLKTTGKRIASALMILILAGLVIVKRKKRASD